MNLAGQLHFVLAVLALAPVFVGRAVANAKTANLMKTKRFTGKPMQSGAVQLVSGLTWVGEGSFRRGQDQAYDSRPVRTLHAWMGEVDTNHGVGRHKRVSQVVITIPGADQLNIGKLL